MHTSIKTSSPRYCYSVWLRHLCKAHEYGLPTHPATVAEIGPGGSLGVGISALLSGANRYYALDIVEHIADVKIVETFEELCKLFSTHAKIPDKEEFPKVKPDLATYSFPRKILTENRLAETLEIARVLAIRNAISSIGNKEGQIQISYVVPWMDLSSLEEASLDILLSQAVLEHVDDIESAYRAFYHWLKPGGFMSHQIDFRCHDVAREWNGHWTYSDFTWRLIKGQRPYLINRYPYSMHISIMREVGFEIIAEERVKAHSKIQRRRLADRFQSLSNDDLTTRSAHILALKR
jgi:predicted SAM-dependent methyltransferase